MNTHKILGFSFFLICVGLSQSLNAAVPEAISRHYQQSITATTQIQLKAPDIAENGAVVPVTIEFANQDSQHISEIALFNAKRADQALSVYKINPQMNLQRLGTRIKLGESTDIYAVARMDDGKVVAVSKQIKVTIGGCGGS